MSNIGDESKLKNENIWNQKTAEELYSLFLNSILKGNILELLKSNIDKEYKSKIFKDFKSICRKMVNGYKQEDLQTMKNGINQMIKLINYTKEIGEK